MSRLTRARYICPVFLLCLSCLCILLVVSLSGFIVFVFGLSFFGLYLVPVLFFVVVLTLSLSRLNLARKRDSVPINGASKTWRTLGLSCLVLPCLFLSCLVLSSLILSFLAICCFITSCLVVVLSSAVV